MYISPSTAETQRRLSRKQSQARTRERLLESAARAFASDGIESTSIERIAAGAGHTRGAFYAHFKDKQDLSLTMLEQQFDAYIERFSHTLASAESPAVRARHAGDDLSRLLEADPRWQRLSFEFASYALRDDAFRRELVKRYESLRERVAKVFRQRAEEHGVESPIPFERLTLMTFVISTGITTTMLLEPDRIPQDLQGEMLSILFLGLGSMAERSTGA